MEDAIYSVSDGRFGEWEVPCELLNRQMRLSHGIFREISLSIDCFSVSVQNKYNLSLIRFYVFEKLIK